MAIDYYFTGIYIINDIFVKYLSFPPLFAFNNLSGLTGHLNWATLAGL